jgi:hypothetical protein
LATPFLTIEGNAAYEGEGGWLAEPVLTFEGNKIYRGRKGWLDRPYQLPPWVVEAWRR